LFQTTAVSRWLVMPSAARSDAPARELFSVVCTTDRVRSAISTGECSTQPARGRICSCSSWCLPTSLPLWSKSMNRVLVVPWSIAPIRSAMTETPTGDRLEPRAAEGQF